MWVNWFAAGLSVAPAGVTPGEKKACEEHPGGGGGAVYGGGVYGGVLETHDTSGTLHCPSLHVRLFSAWLTLSPVRQLTVAVVPCRALARSNGGE